MRTHPPKIPEVVRHAKWPLFMLVFRGTGWNGTAPEQAWEKAAGVGQKILL